MKKSYDSKFKSRVALEALRGEPHCNFLCTNSRKQDKLFHQKFNPMANNFIGISAAYFHEHQSNHHTS